MTLGIAGLAIWAGALVARAAVSRAVTIVSTSFLVVVLIATALMPLLQPALLIAVLMAVALALPYLDRRALGRLTIAAGAIGVITVVLARLQAFMPGLPALPPLIAEPNRRGC